MQERDNTFFEAYKRLDRLCADMYGGQNGVSQYLEDMERQPYRDRLAVPRWEESYKTLKHLRWVRNRIAHETGTVSVCEEQDLRDVTGFYNAILAGQDPLATLYRRRRAPTPRTAPAVCRRCFWPLPWPSACWFSFLTDRRKIWLLYFRRPAGLSEPLKVCSFLPQKNFSLADKNRAALF